MKNRHIKKIIKFFKKNQEGYTGSVLMNRLGWQVFRTLWHNFIYKFWPYIPDSGVKEYIRTLKKDGIVIIPNFLNKETFTKLRNEFEKEKQKTEFIPFISPHLKDRYSESKLVFGTIKQTNDSQSNLFFLIDKHIRENHFIRKVASSVMKKNIDKFAVSRIFIYKKINDTLVDIETTRFFHSDVAYPSVKAFLYLNDVDKNNGAFIYSKGSHKLTFRRLIFEYIKSIRRAKVKAGDVSLEEKEEADKRGWHGLTEDEERFLKIKGFNIEGKANTLIIFNVMGYHRRGDFSSNNPRELIAVGYRK